MAATRQPDPDLSSEEKKDSKDMFQVPAKDSEGKPLLDKNGKEVREDTDSFQTPLNRLLNLLDPPKDLTVGGALTNLTPDQQKTLLQALKELFGGFEGLEKYMTEEDFKVVGDQKEKIAKSVRDAYGEHMDRKKHTILREKHSSGHSSNPDRPNGFYIIQDNGSTDVVENPTLLITPAAVLDPAGKTKSGKYVIKEFPKLFPLYLKRVSFEKALEALSMREVSNKYTTDFFLPWKPNEDKTKPSLQVSFNTRTFDAEGENAEYFAGNATKNAAIKQILEKKDITKEDIESIKLYLLMKEIGDTLQVQWGNYIFDKDTDAKIRRDNTIICTTDTVVLLRAIINRVGVIFTNSKGETTYFFPRVVDAAAKRAIDKAFVITIQTDLVTKNETVIQMLKDLVKQGEAIPGSGGEKWINGNTWSFKQRTNCIAYLKDRIAKLEAYNKDCNAYMSALANPDAARAYADTKKLLSPVVLKKGDTYHTINSVTDLNPKEKSFKCLLKSPSSFDAPDFLTRLSGGGPSILPGFAPLLFATFLALYPQQSEVLRQMNPELPSRELLERVLSAVPMKGGDPILNSPIYKSNKDLPIPLHMETRATSTLASVKAGSARRTLSAEDRAIFILSKEASSASPFLYCFLRQFMPEVFTYALHVKAALEGMKIAYPDLQKSIDDFWMPGSESLTQATLDTYYSADESYLFTDDGAFQANLVYTAEQKTMLQTISEWALYFGGAFFMERYPALKSDLWSTVRIKIRFTTRSGSLSDMFELESVLVPESSGPERQEDWLSRLQLGGGKDPFQTALAAVIGTVAMDLYELSYSLSESAMYLNVPRESLLLQRVVLLRGFLDASDNPYQQAELPVILAELSNLPAVQMKLSEGQALVEQAIREKTTRGIPSTLSLSPIEAYGGTRKKKRNRKSKRRTYKK